MNSISEDYVNRCIEGIPARIWEEIRTLKALQAGFAAGPSFVGGVTQRYDDPVSIEEGLRWLSRYSRALRVACIQLEDRTLLYFGPRGFDRRDTSGAPPPSPGITVRHPPSTNDEEGTERRRSTIKEGP